MPINNPVPSVPVNTNIFCGYTDLSSVAQNGTIVFYVTIPGVSQNDPQQFQIDIYRQGEGIGNPIDTLYGTAFEQQDATNDPDQDGCGWEPSLTFNLPDDNNHKSGAYIAKLSTTNHDDFPIVFFIKTASPGQNGKILFVSSVSTWQAYNIFKNKNLYGDLSGIFENRARKVSLLRPVQYGGNREGAWWFIQWERQFIQWFYKAKTNNLLPSDMEMEFCTSIDLHADPDLVNNYKLILSIGHDEYWSWEMRDTIENFIAAGGNVAFLSGNVSWWQVRFEEDDLGTPITMVCYKDAEEDPEQNEQLKTINWFEESIGRPENLMTGLSYYWGTALWAGFDSEYKVSLQRHWLFKDTDVEDRDSFGAELFDHFETDAADFRDLDRKFPIPTGNLAFETTEFTAPKDFMILASANLTGVGENEGSYDGPSNHNGWATMGIFRIPGGGFVFHGSNYNWARNGLSPYISNNDWNIFSKITKNILETLGDDFEAQPFLLINGDFENGNLNGWTKIGGGSASVSSPGYSSNYCSFIDASSGGDTFLFQQYIPIRANRNYRIRCYALPGSSLSGPGGGSAISIRLETLDEYNKPIQEIIVANYPSSGDGWLEISAQGSISSSEVFMIQTRVKVYVKSGYSAYFDNIVVEEMP